MKKHSIHIFVTLFLVLVASTVLAYFYSREGARPDLVEEQEAEPLTVVNSEESSSLYPQTFASEILPYSISYDSAESVVDEQLQQPLAKDSTVDERSIVSAGALYTATFRGVDLNAVAVSSTFEPVAIENKGRYISDFELVGENILSLSVVGVEEPVLVEIETQLKRSGYDVYIFRFSTGLTEKPMAAIRIPSGATDISVLTFSSQSLEELTQYMNTLSINSVQ